MADGGDEVLSSESFLRKILSFCCRGEERLFSRPSWYREKKTFHPQCAARWCPKKPPPWAQRPGPPDPSCDVSRGPFPVAAAAAAASSAVPPPRPPPCGAPSRRPFLTGVRVIATFAFRHGPAERPPAASHTFASASLTHFNSLSVSQ